MELDGSSAIVRVRPRAGASIADSVSAVLRDSSVKVLELRTETGRLDEAFRIVTAMAREAAP